MTNDLPNDLDIKNVSMERVKLILIKVGYQSNFAFIASAYKQKRSKKNPMGGGGGGLSLSYEKGVLHVTFL